MENKTTAAIVETFSNTVQIDGTKRDAKATADLTVLPDGEGTVQIQLIVSHDKDRKAFRRTVNIQRAMPDDGPFAVTKWEPMNQAHNARLAPIPCARYSEKLLAYAWATTIGELRADPDMLAALDLDAVNVG